MLTVELSQIGSTPNSLRIGVVIRYGQDGPVRFAQLVVEDDCLSWQDLQTLVDWGVRQTNRHLDREREVEEHDTLPGL